MGAPAKLMGMTRGERDTNRMRMNKQASSSDTIIKNARQALKALELGKIGK
jgi:hypothetical protein